MNRARYESLLNDPEPGSSIHDVIPQVSYCFYCGEDIEEEAHEYQGRNYCNEACSILAQLDVRPTLKHMVRKANVSGDLQLAEVYQKTLDEFEQGFAVAKQIISESFEAK